MSRTFRLLLIAVCAAVAALAVAGGAGAASQTESTYYDGFPDLTGLDLTRSANVALDTLGGVRLKTIGPSNAATWTTSADFTTPAAPLGPMIGLSTLDATTTPNTLRLASSPLAFRRAQEGPVLRAAASLSVDGYAVGGMCVRRVDRPDARYYMWYTGVPEDQYTKLLYLATSNDGVSWTKEPAPVLSVGEPGSFDARQIGKPTVLYDPANAEAPFRMWYSAEGDVHGSIGYATSLDGRVWTKAGEVLGPGRAGSADSFALSQPSVVYDSAQSIYTMWYTADDSVNLRVSYATSADGIAWDRGGVVFDVGGGGNFSLGAWAPSVWKDAGGYRMIFTGYKYVAGSEVQAKLITASSPDGLAWNPGNIALNPSPGSFDGYNMSQPEVIFDSADGAAPYKMWYVGNQPDANGNYHDRIGLATSLTASHWTKVAGPSTPDYLAAVMTYGEQGTALDSMSVADLRPIARPGGAATDLYGFYTGTQGADFRQRIGLMQSSDGGATWTDGGATHGAPFIDVGPGGAFDAGGVAAPAAVDTGSGFLIYHTSLSSADAATIGLHMAAADLSSVTRVASPVLDAGAGWDANGRADPAVITQGSALTMFYAGEDATGVWSIGRATGDTGTPTVLTVGGQVLAPTPGSYDAGGLRHPVVLLRDGEWEMWYAAVGADGVQRMAYATSPDGAAWTKQGLAMAPAISAYDFAEQAVAPGGAWIDGSAVKLTFTGTDRFGWTRAGLASAAGPGSLDSGSATFELDNAAPQDWRKIIWSPTAIPAGTAMTVWASYLPAQSTIWSDWMQMTSGQDLPFSLAIENVRWQVRMTSSDPAASPQIDNLTVDHADIVFPASGTAVTVPIAPPVDHYLLTWGNLTVNSDQPAGTGAGVAVCDASGMVLVAEQPLTGSGETLIPLASVPSTSGPLVCVFTLTTSAQSGAGAASPKLLNLKVDYASTLTPSSLTLIATPPVVVPGSSTVLSGNLMSGATPLAGQTVTVSARTPTEVAFTSIGTAVTADDGSYSLPALTPAGDTYYKAEWPGGTIGVTTYPPAVSIIEVLVAYPTNLTLTAPQFVQAGSAPELVGSLTGGDGTALPGQTVTIESSPAGGSAWTSVGTAVTQADGSYSLTGLPISADTDVRVTWRGGRVADTPWAPAMATATIGIGAPSSVSVVAKPTIVVFGGSSTLSGRLLVGAAPLAGQTIAIQSSPAGASAWRAVSSAVTAADGTYTKAVKPQKNTDYRAVWLGGSVGGTAYASSAAAVTVRVRPRVTLVMRSYVSKVGSYYRYRYGSRVVMKGSVAPNHYRLGNGTAGSVSVKVYKRTYSTTLRKYVWRYLTTSRRTLSSTSAYSWSWACKSRGSYRLRASFAADTDHLAATSVYRYVTVR